jgi:hypothetical protein
VSMASVQEAAPMRKSKAYGGKAAKAGPKAAHIRGDAVRGAIHAAPAPKSSGFSSAPHGQAARRGQAPPATSLVGSMRIIESPRKGRDHNLGIPGIISSTSLGPEQRSRLVSGIIESPMSGHAADGPVHKIMGHDATAYNEGMVHLRGSHFK